MSKYKISSPLRHLGTGEGHALMTKEKHIDAHGGDVVAAGYDAPETSKTSIVESQIIKTKDIATKEVKEITKPKTLTILDNPKKYTQIVNILGETIVDIKNLTKGVYFVNELKDDGKNISHKIEFDGEDYSVFNLSNFDNIAKKKEEKRKKIKPQSIELSDGSTIETPLQEDGKIDVIDLLFGKTASKIATNQIKTSIEEGTADEVVKGNLKIFIDEVTPTDTDVINYANEINFNLMEYYYSIASESGDNKHQDLMLSLLERVNETKELEVQDIQKELKGDITDERKAELESRLSEIHHEDVRRYSSVITNPERAGMIKALKDSNFDGTKEDWERVLREIPLLKKEVDDFLNHNVNEWQNEQIKINATKFIKDNYNADYDPTMDDEQFELLMDAKWTTGDFDVKLKESLSSINKINNYIEDLETKINFETSSDRLDARVKIKNRLDILTAEDYIPEGENGKRIKEIKKEIDDIINAKHGPITIGYFKRKGIDLPPKYSTQEEVDEANKKIEVLQNELKVLYAPTQREIERLSKTYNTQIENINTLIKLHGDALDIMEKTQNYAVDLYDEAENLNIVLDALGRNHNKLDIFVKSVNNSLSSFQLAAGESLEKYIGVPVYYALDKITGQNKLPQLEGKNEYETMLQKSIDRNNLSMPERMKVNEIRGWGDFAEWSLRGVGDQSFTIASLILLKRPIAMTGFFLQGSGQKFDQMNQELAMTPGLNYTPWQYYTAATWAGGVEVGTEYITARIFSGIGNRFQLGKSAKFKTGFRESMRKNFFTTRGVVRNVVDPLAEGGSELSVLFADGLSDKYILGKDVNVLGSLKEEGLDVFATSVLHAGFLYKSPLIYQEISGWMQSKPTIQKFGENAAEIIKYEELAANPNIDKSTRKIYEKKIDDLVIKNNKILQLQISNIDLLTKESKTRLIDINNKIYDKKLEANELANNDNLTQQVSEEEVQSIVNEIENLENEKDLIIKEVEGDIDFDKLTEHIERNNNTTSESKTTQENNFNYQQSLYDKVKKGVINHQAFDDSKITIVEKNNDLETREAWEKIVNQDVTYLEMMLEEDDLNPQEIQNIESEINNLKSTLTDIDLESSQFGRHYGFVYNSITTGQKAIIVNKDRMKTSAEGQTVLKHEWLHVVVNDIIHNTNFESETAAGLELFQYIKQEYNKQNLDKSFDETKFVKRLAEYEEDGVDIQASEVFTLLSDAFTAGDIVYNPKETSFLDKIKKYINNMLVSYGFKDLKLETAEDLYDFVKTYNTSIEKGGKGREARIVDIAITKGKEQKLENEKSKQQFSKNVDQEVVAKPDLKTDFDNFVQKPDRTKKYETKEDFQQSVDFFPAYDMIVNSKKLDGLVMANVSDVIQPAQMSEFVNKVKEKIGDRLMKNFDPAINESLFGWLTGKAGGRGESIIFRAKGDVMNEYKKEIQATSLDQEAQRMVQIEAKADASLETFENQDLTKEKVKKVKGIKLSEKLGPTAQDINRFVKSKAVGMDVSNLNFKKLQDLTPELTQAMFGVIPKVGNLTKQDIKNAQMFINKNADVLKAMLPEGSTASGTSTGVQKVLLDAFYTKSDRVKAAKTGSKAGLAVQIKNQNIQTKDFLEVFGITERGKENTYKKDSNTSSRIKALIAQTGRMMTNQAVREHLIERQASMQTIQRLAEGKADVMFSKDEAATVESVDPKGDKLFPNQELYADLDFDGGQLNIEFEHSDRSNISKVLKTHTGENLFQHKTKKEIDNYFNEFENVIISNLPQNFHGGAIGSFVYNSHRMLPNKGVDKLDKLVNGKEITIKDYFKQKKDILVERHKNGELNYGMDFKGEGAKYVYGKTFGEMFGKTNAEIVKKFDDGTREKFNAIHLSMHSQLWQRVNASISADQKNAKIWANYFAPVGNNSKHPQKIGVDYIGYSINPKGYKPGPKAKFKLYEWEHAMMATKQYVYLFDSILDKGSNFNAAYFFAQRNYKLIALDNRHDKIQIKKSGRTTSMGRVWNSETNSWDTWNLIQHSFLDRYFNPETFAIDGGIPPSSIMGPNKKTFEEIYNINVDGSPRGTIPGIKSKIRHSKAINNSRAININTESRGMSAWDFDDTLATTKSGVRATIPNLGGTPQPGRKVIFLAGGAGSGKSNVVSKLGLENQGFKIVNSDISLEWLKKNSGLPENMNDLTKEQLSTLGKLQHQSRKIAKDKMMKYQGNAEGVVVDGTGGSIKAMTKLVNEFKDKGYDVSMVFVETSLETALERNRARKERSLLDKIVIKNHEAVQGNKDGFKEMFGERFMEVKTDNLTQEDAMPVDLVTKMDDFVSSYQKVRLDAEEFATQGADILAQGGEFDFTEFDVVTEGAQGPMFKTAMDRAKKYGTKDTYVLTARPPAAAEPIQQFLASQGLNIPLENITGLGNSTGEAKAEWMLEKFSEGYNNMFFADDAMQNVEAVKDVLDQLDIKSEVVQAKIQFSKKMESTMDEILTDPKMFKSKQQVSLNNVKNVNGLTNDGVYSNIKFSKKHRGEYENLISKNRPDLVKEGLISKTVDAMFNYVDGLDIPADKKRKYEKITTKWLATSNIKLNEDSYKVKDAVELAEKHKEDIFSYNNPNEIIEKYAGKSKAKPINPNKVEEFGKGMIINGKYNIVAYEVQDTQEGMAAVRKVVDTHFGPKSNPWCIIARKSKDKLLGREDVMDDAWRNWITYRDGPKRIIFQDGKLIGFYANDLYWDRMDNDTDHVVITKKEGNVTEKVELVEVNMKVEEFVMERRTVSKDKNTVTTEYFIETKDYLEGTKIVENRVNGITVKSTRSRKDGTVQEIINYDKKGKAISGKNFDPNGELVAVNTFGRIFGEAKVEQIIKEKGDQVELMDINRFGKGDYFAESLVGDKIAEIGFQLGRDVKLESVLKTSPDGKIRLDLNKVLEADPNARFMVPGVSPTTLSSVQFSKKIDVDLNLMLEQSMNVDAKKRFSAAQAKLRGGKFKLRGLVPPSAQDFMGLLYNLVGKGKQGDQHLEMLKKALVDPFARGVDELNASRQNSAEDYRALLKQFPEVKKILNEKIGNTGFTVDQAIRVYLWNKAGFDVPGLSARDLKTLSNFVKEDAELVAFAEALGMVSKKAEGYSKPGEYWLTENISSDLMSDGAVGDARAEFLSEWIENKNIIFSEENLNKIEAIYGSKFREALKDVLYRMETGTNRPKGGGRLMNEYMNWVNGSVGAIMFFNIRSAVLQTISATNYINWSDNNPLKAAAAFANQKQFWSDFVMLFNSDYLKQRRAGNRRGVNEAELSRVVVGVDPINQAKAVIRYLLKIGFLPTQIADSFAIASGGAGFYRNRVKTYVKQGMSKTEAEAQAFLDFQETTEVSQQSARPDMISQQQANPLGRLILAFQNTPMQYGRIMNKAFRDIVNGRGDTKSHVSKIIYYGAIQAVIFTALQNALFAVIGSEDDDEKEEMIDKKTKRMFNSMMDTWLSAFGYGGKAVATVKNTIMEYDRQRARDVDDNFMTKSDHAYTLLQALSFSPPIGSKLRKIYQSIQTEKFNRDLLKDRGFKLDNPVWSMIGNIVEATTNIPLGRLSKKLLNIENAMDSRNETWKRIALILGWSTWDLDIKDPDLETLKLEIKDQKKQEKELEKQEKKEEKLKKKYPNKTPEEIDVILKSKELFDLSKQDQIDLLKKLKVSDKEIEKLKKEQDRTDKIAELYKDNSELIDDFVKEAESKPKKKKEKKKEVKLSKSEKRKKDLFKMKKQDQINRLMELGYPTRKIYSLRYEKDRVEMIMKLEEKKSK